jgi:hypothetical protein
MEVGWHRKPVNVGGMNASWRLASYWKSWQGRAKCRGNAWPIGLVGGGSPNCERRVALQFGKMYEQFTDEVSLSNARLLRFTKQHCIFTAPSRSGTSRMKMKMGMEHWWNSTDGGNRSTGRVALCPPQISLGLTWDRTRTSEEREWHLTFSATEGGTIYWKCIERFNSYLAVNTFHLGLKSWLTMYEAVIAVCCQVCR